MFQFIDYKAMQIVGIFMLGLSPFLLGGCGSDWIYQDPLAFLYDNDNEEEEKEEESQTQAPSLQAGPLAAPAQQNVPPRQAGAGNAQGMSAMGVNLETYLAYDIKDPKERIKRLEQAVIAMHKDLQSLSSQKQNAIMSPAIPSAAMPAGNMPGLTDNPEPQPTSQPINLRTAPGQISAPGMAATNTTAVQPGSRRVYAPGSNAVITGIRVGEHSDKVRLVFDSTSKTDFFADLDNQENILVVEFPNARWQTPTNFESFGKMPVLKSYRVDPLNNGDGNLFVLQLKGNTRILAQGKYPALSGEGERIVIDLKK